MPPDAAILLGHAEELAGRTGVRLSGRRSWAPWLDTGYLTEADRADPDIMANVRAIAEVCGLVAFVAETDDEEYYGYWRGPGRAPIAGAPVVVLDNEGIFNVAGSSLAEAILGRLDGERFTETRDWFRTLGIAVEAESWEAIEIPEVDPTPDRIHDELYERFREGRGT